MTHAGGDWISNPAKQRLQASTWSRSTSSTTS
jgi:hypothetical protein